MMREVALAVRSAVSTFRILRQKNGAVTPKNPEFIKIFGWDEDSKLKQPYKQNATVYAAVRAIAVNIAQVPWVITRLGSEAPITSGPIWQLFEDVNPYLSKFQLFEATITSLCLKGEWFVFQDPQKVAGGIPVALWPEWPDNVEGKQRNGVLVGWELKKGSRSEIFPTEEVLQDKYYNPWSLYRGLSPLAAADLGLQADFAAVRFNKLFFDQGGMTGEVFGTEQNLTDDQYQRLKRQIIDRRRGVDSAHLGLLLDGGMKMQGDRATIKDMQFVELRKYSREEVMMIYKVPKAELSLYEDVNYATAISADLGFWKKTLFPIMRATEDKWNQAFLRPLGYEAHFDASAIDVLNAEVLEKTENASKLWAMDVPFNAINERLGLGFPEIPGGDVPRSEKLGGGVFPQLAARDVTPRRLPIAGRLMMEQAAPDFSELRGKTWQRILRPVQPVTSECSRAVKRYWYEVEQALLKQLSKSARNEVGFTERDLEELLDDKKLVALLLDYLKRAYFGGVATIGMGVKIPDKVAVARLMERTQVIQGINETTRKRLLAALADDVLAGLPERERAETVIRAVKETMDIAKHRARTIARTETHAAYNTGRFDSMAKTGPSKKMWLSSRDAKVRDEHVALDGEQMEFAKPFSNGLMFPCESGAAAEQTINCRCVCVPIYEGEDEGELLERWRLSTPEEFAERVAALEEE